MAPKLTFRLWVVEEHLQAVDEVGSVERVSSDAHTQGLPQAHHGGLVDSLVGQGARAGHDA
jgi:hypothetical protein